MATDQAKEVLVAQAEALEELAAEFNKHTDVGAHWHRYISNRAAELRAQAAAIPAHQSAVAEERQAMERAIEDLVSARDLCTCNQFGGCEFHLLVIALKARSGDAGALALLKHHGNLGDLVAFAAIKDHSK